MKKKYTKTKSGMEYLIYDEPICMKKVDIIINYVEGGTLLYRSCEDPEELEVLAHIKYMKDATNSQIRREITRNVAFSKLHPYRMESFNPTRETEIDLKMPYIYTEDKFFSESNEYIRYVVAACKKIYSVDEDEIRFYYNRDRRYGGVILYGYSIHKLPNDYFEGYPLTVSDITYEEYLEERNSYTEDRKRHLRLRAREEALQQNISVEEMLARMGLEPDFDEIDIEIPLEDVSDDIKDSLKEDMKLPKIAFDIRKWLNETDFNDFCKAITDRVKGQEETEMVAINLYNYLECVAYGKKHNNNLLMAAPSGCGKTETYRAVKDYFSETIPGLVIYQLDMTSITEEGFKGKDTNFIVAPLNDRDGGIGIAFLDEFDKKLVPSFSSNGSNVNLAVQTQILTLIEGRKMHESNGIDTSNTMFIGMGAFDPCRAKKAVGEKHIGFGQENVKGQSHYANITREDMIELGACYELLGRFSSIINYHELKEEVVDEIIDGMLAKVSSDIGCKIKISDSVRSLLHENANSKYGCRILDSIIRENAMKGYLAIRKENRDIKTCYLVIEDIGKIRIRAFRAGKAKGNKNVSVSARQHIECEAS